MPECWGYRSQSSLILQAGSRINSLDNRKSPNIDQYPLLITFRNNSKLNGWPGWSDAWVMTPYEMIKTIIISMNMDKSSISKGENLNIGIFLKLENNWLLIPFWILNVNIRQDACCSS